VFTTNANGFPQRIRKGTILKSESKRSRGLVIDLFTKKSITCPSDLLPLPETFGCIDMGDQKVIADETVREVLLSKCGARTIPEFQLHTKDRQKDIVRDVMRELGAGPRQMVRVCGLTYAVVYKMWKDL